MNNPALLLEVSPLELMKLWGELVEAYHGVNGFGGDTAELYAYRFLPYVSSAESAENENYFKARHKLNALLEMFCVAYRCSVLVDGRHPSHYAHETFSWRAQIKIVKDANDV